MTPRQREILEAMRHGPMTAVELSKTTSIGRSWMSDLLAAVHKAGLTERYERKPGATGSNWEYVYSLSDAGRKAIGLDTSGNNPFLWRSFKQPVAMGAI